jgi:signal transduction histidine kinase
VERHSVSVSLRLLVAVVITAVVGDAWLSYRNIDTLLSQERAISASYMRLNALQRTLAAVTDAETGQRGYLLTGDEAYLTPYDDARHAIESDLRELRATWSDGAGGDLDALDRLVRAKLQELEQTIALRRDGRLTAADTMMRRGRGKEQMDAIRAVIETLRSDEQARLRAATATSAASRRTAFTTAAFASTVALVVVLLCVGLMRRDLVQRTRVAEERAELLRREQEARRQAELANKLKDDFLATLSHELRNPLHAVVGWLQILRLRGTEEPLRERAIDTIERNARALQRMIEDLLDASRASRGKLELTLAPIPLGTLISSVLETVRPTAVARQIEMAEHLAAADAVVSADYDRLAQVVINLVSNAIKFTPEGGRVDVLLERDSDAVVITVRDTGRGISRDALGHIFEPFRQTGPRMAGAEGGLGLGLSIAKQIVELHGGTIRADSEGLGKGATFVVRLPPAQVAAAAT